MLEHTPGPWVAATLLGHPAIRDLEGYPILEWNDWCNYYGKHAKEATANVALAAAAPDLLAACERIAEQAVEETGLYVAFAMFAKETAKAAIAKSKGESNA